MRKAIVSCAFAAAAGICFFGGLSILYGGNV